MKIHCACWVLATALLSAGCPPQERPGLVADHEAIFMVGSANDSYTKNDPTKRQVFLRDPIETRGVMVFDVIKENAEPLERQEYRVIVGTSKGDDRNVKGRFIRKDHPKPPTRRPKDWFHLSGNCWVYVYGEGPMLQTDIVEAGADGSRLLIQIDTVNGVIVHRVYFLAGSSAWVWNRKPPYGKFPLAPPPHLPQFVPGYFVEARKDGTVTNPQPTPLPNSNGTEIQKFLHYVYGQIKPFK